MSKPEWYTQKANAESRSKQKQAAAAEAPVRHAMSKEEKIGARVKKREIFVPTPQGCNHASRR